MMSLGPSECGEAAAARSSYLDAFACMEFRHVKEWRGSGRGMRAGTVDSCGTETALLRSKALDIWVHLLYKSLNLALTLQFTILHGGLSLSLSHDV